MTPEEINAAIDIAIARAADLRAAGIERFHLGALEFDIGPVEPPVPVEMPRKRHLAEVPRGPLDSARSFGVSDQRGVPRFKRDASPDDDEIPEGLE